MADSSHAAPNAPISVEVEDFQQFALKNLRVLNRQKQLVPLSLNAVQLDYIRKSTKRDLIIKARQHGFSTLFQAINYFRLVTRTSTTLTLGKDDENTAIMRRLFQRYHDEFAGSVKPMRRLDNARLSTFSDTSSEAIIATAGAGSSGRGATITYVHGSEAAYWKNAEAIISGALQAGDPCVALETTTNGARGYLYELAMGALEGKNDWTLHFYEWWWTPEYQLPLEPGERIDYDTEEAALVAKHGLSPEQIKWRRLKKRELGRLFLQEYPEDVLTCFLMSGVGYYGALENVFVAPTDLLWQHGHRYVGGLDWGQSDDFTVLSVFDATANIEVDLLRLNKMAYKEMRRQIIQKCKKWHIDTLVAEKNAMGANIESLVDELIEDGSDTTVMPYTMTNPGKAALTADFHAAIYEGGWKLQPDEWAARELRAVVAKQTPTGAWTYAAEEPEHDDSYIGRILAYHGVHNRGIESAPAPAEFADYRGI